MNENVKDQDVLLVKEKESNDVKAVKGIDNDKKKLETVAPNLANQPDFMKIDKNGNALDNFFENFSRQFKNPTEFIFFKVPAAKHAISPDSVEWKKFENFGITRETVEKSGNLEKLLDYQKTNLLPIVLKIGSETLYSDARFSLRKQEDGTFSPAVHLIRHKPELERPYFGVKFTDEDKKNLLTTGNLGRIVEAEYKKGEKTPVLLSLDKQTNELTAFRTEWLKVPDSYKGVQLNEEQKQKLSLGEKIELTGMTSMQGKKFDAGVQFNADKRFFELVFDKEKQAQNQTFKIPQKIGGVVLTEQQQNDLKDGKTIYVKGMKNKEEKTYNAFIKVNENEKKLDFSFKKNDKKEEQADKQDKKQTEKQETKKSKGRKV